jgi:hypothetical protein
MVTASARTLAPWVYGPELVGERLRKQPLFRDGTEGIHIDWGAVRLEDDGEICGRDRLNDGFIAGVCDLRALNHNARTHVKGPCAERDLPCVLGQPQLFSLLRCKEYKSLLTPWLSMADVDHR